MPEGRQPLGAAGEQVARAFLEQAGYKILRENYRSRLGEIDLIAMEGEVLVFVEVKARQSRRFGTPQEAVGGEKQRQILRVASAFLMESRLGEIPCRFDVVAVTFRKGARGPMVEHIRDAFSADRSGRG
ncbi:MAG: YraN family protein [Candidatus Methylomirabilales bacterium]